MAKWARISLFKLVRSHHLHQPTYPSKPFPKPLARVPTQLGPDSPLVLNSKSLHTPSFFVYISRHPFGEDPQNRCWTHQTRRRNHGTESAPPELDVTKEVDFINRSFAEAREEIEMAMESKESVYFDEEVECAREAVKKVIELYEGLLGKLPEKEKSAIQRSMGLKIEQLKAELKQLDD